MNMLLINLIGWFLCSMTNMKDHSTEICQMKMTAQGCTGIWLNGDRKGGTT